MLSQTTAIILETLHTTPLSLSARSSAPTPRSGSPIKRIPSAPGKLINMDFTDDQFDKIIEENLKKIGPRIYHLSTNDNGKCGVFATGCWGEKENEAIRQSREKMNSIAKEKTELENIEIVGTLSAGDHFYLDGVNSYDDERFNSQFHAIFCNDKHTHIAKPVFATLGNHDAGLHHWNKPHDTMSYISGGYWPAKIRGKALETYQVGYTYLQNNEGAVDSKSHWLANIRARNNLFKKDEIHINELPHWMMPYYYYGIEKNNMLMLFLNSNTLPKDFLDLLEAFFKYKSSCDLSIEIHDWLEKDPKWKKNQAGFLITEYKKARNKEMGVIIVEHNPLFPLGKRAYSNDWDARLYLNPAEIEKIDDFLQLLTKIKTNNPDRTSFQPDPNNNNYALIINKFFNLFDIHGDLHVNAHEHEGSYFYSNQEKTDDVFDVKKPAMPQLETGAGSNKLHDRCYFEQHEQLGFFAKEPGFAFLSWHADNPTLINIDYYTNEGKHLTFTNKSPLPQFEHSSQLSTDHEDMRQVKNIIQDACNKYQKFLNTKQNEYYGKFFSMNFTHDIRDVNHMHSMLNIINGYEYISLYELFEKINPIIDGIVNKNSANSLYISIRTPEFLTLQVRYQSYLSENEFIPIENVGSNDNKYSPTSPKCSP